MVKTNKFFGHFEKSDNVKDKKAVFTRSFYTLLMLRPVCAIYIFVFKALIFPFSLAYYGEKIYFPDLYILHIFSPAICIPASCSQLT